MITEDEREMYFLHSRTKGYKHRIEEAIQTAQKAIKEIGGNHALSYSGGKDSTVMLDICLRAGFKGELIQFFYSEFENPKMNLEMAGMIAEKIGLNLHRLKCYSSKEAWNEAGRFYVVPSNDLEKRLVRKVSEDFGKQSNKISKENGYKLHFIGMRKAESKQRRMTLGSRGLTYYAKTREAVTCCPIGKLIDDDIWAYIICNNLPYISCYDNPLFDRRKIRNELTYFCTRNAVFQGVVETYKFIYPEIFAELRANYPETSNYM